MVDAWHAIGARRALEEYEGVVLVAVVQTLLEGVVVLPVLADLVGCLCEIQLFILLIVLLHLRKFLKPQR